MRRKRIRPTNKVQVGSQQQTGRVVRAGRRKQGGAWVPVYKVRLNNEAVRTVRADLVRPAM